jgi:DNA repair exonuclease SbcCD nuclease subunit
MNSNILCEKRVLVIGDIHFKIDNIQESYEFIRKIDEYIKENINKIDYVIVLGDILHTHEKVHTEALNIALEFFKMLVRYKKDKVYVIVGNHDMTTNTNFLNEGHWMNCLKEWNNIKVVDKVITIDIDKEDYLTLCPYVPDGRLIEALNTMKDKDWKNSTIIFCHQLLNGAKMGAIKAENVEEWEVEYPLCISGHIHDKQWVKDNLYYTGSSRQIAYGEGEDKTISLVIIEEEIEIKEINLELPTKRIIYMDVEDIEKKIDKLNIKNNEEIKLVVSGDETYFKEYKKTDKLKKILESKGIKKIIFKKKDLKVVSPLEIKSIENKEFIDEERVFDENRDKNDFLELLDYMIKEDNDEELYKLYKSIVYSEK